LIPGVRLDYFHQLKHVSVNPRIAQRLTVSDTTTLKAGLGLYTQPPIYHEAFFPIGNPELEPYHSIHASVGFEQAVSDNLSLDVEGFHKYLYNRVVNTEHGESPVFVNDGKGRIYGAELGANYRSSFGLSGQLSYTYSKSQRQDRSDDWRLFDEDQPHILNLAAGYELGAGWQVGTRFRYVSGNPVTDIIGSVY